MKANIVCQDLPAFCNKRATSRIVTTLKKDNLTLTSTARTRQWALVSTDVEIQHQRIPVGLAIPHHSESVMCCTCRRLSSCAFLAWRAPVGGWRQPLEIGLSHPQIPAWSLASEGRLGPWRRAAGGSSWTQIWRKGLEIAVVDECRSWPSKWRQGLVLYTAWHEMNDAD